MELKIIAGVVEYAVVKKARIFLAEANDRDVTVFNQRAIIRRGDKEIRDRNQRAITRRDRLCCLSTSSCDYLFADWSGLTDAFRVLANASYG